MTGTTGTEEVGSLVVDMEEGVEEGEVAEGDATTHHEDGHEVREETETTTVTVTGEVRPVLASGELIMNLI